MSRAVIVSTPWPDNPVINYWEKINKPWLNQVHRVYHAYSSEIPYPHSVEAKIKESTEDTLLIMHDDVFVYNPGIINSYFALAEQEKVVAPLHKPYDNMATVDQMMEKHYGQQIGFFPYFLFITRKNLEKTSIDFMGAKDLELNGVTFSGDQGVKIMVELLKAGAEFEMLPPSNSLQHLPEKPDWVHAQGLGYHFMDKISPGISIDENKLAWLLTLLNLDLLKTVCLAGKYQNYARL